MIDDLDALDLATEEFHRRVDDVQQHHLTLPTPCDEWDVRFLGFRIFGCTVHAWDLATAIGSDPALNPSLVATVLDIMGSEPAGMGFGIEPTASVDPYRTPQEELLALTGRG